jgi:hypothetical protein
VCGRRDCHMQVGHIISVREGRAYGLTDSELFHDDNLTAMCAECNSAQGSETLPLPFLVAALRVVGRQLPLPLLIAVLRLRIANTHR